VKQSLPDTKIPEDNVEHIFDVDPAGEAAELTGGEAQFLGDQFFPATRSDGERAE